MNKTTISLTQENDKEKLVVLRNRLEKREINGTRLSLAEVVRKAVDIALSITN